MSTGPLFIVIYIVIGIAAVTLAWLEEELGFGK